MRAIQERRFWRVALALGGLMLAWVPARAQPATKAVAASGPAASGGEKQTGLTRTPADQIALLDKRQQAFSAGAKGPGLPTKVDLSPYLPPPGDQGAQASCTAWAVGYGLRSYMAKVAQRWDLASGSGVRYDRVFSPAFIYNNTRTADGGATLGAVLAFMRDRGVSTWADFPYGPSSADKKPDDRLLRDAARWRIASFETLDPRVLNIKQQLANGRPVVIGAEISSDFKNGKLGSDFVWRKSGLAVEAHAILLVGYDDQKFAFQLMNSWGQDWGDAGFAWLAYDLVPSVVVEAYVATDVDAAAQATPSPGASVPPAATRRSTPILVGFNIRSGDVLDGITPIFRDQQLLNGALVLSKETRLGKAIGGIGGGEAQILQEGAHVVALRIKTGYYYGARHVISFQADLRDFASGQITSSPWYGSGKRVTSPPEPIVEFKARNGFLISGLEGSASGHTSGETFVSRVEVVETRLDWYK